MFKNIFKNDVIFSLFFGIIFFLIGVFTIKDYGVTWDSANHFYRGQAYLYYFLTGKTDYSDIPKVDLKGKWGDPKSIGKTRVSYYQQYNKFIPGYYLENDSGHPPFSDELSSLFNYIFYQKLGILGDIFSYHLYIVLCSSFLVFVVVYFAKITFGIFPALVSFLTLSTYPLFFSESHFNIKDPPSTAFIAATILSFYKFLENKKGSYKWLISTIVFFTFALSSKFNVLFILFIILPYFALYFKKKNLQYIFSKKVIITLLVAPIFVLGFIFLIWPYLWQDIPNNLFRIVSFYKDIGISGNYQPESFYFFGFNLYPILWILFTTNPYVLLLTTLGIVFAFINVKEKKNVVILWFLWLLIPILRVSLPKTSIYGGIRQIMEFVPAMALIAGYGADQLLKQLKKINKKILMIVVYFCFIFPIKNLLDYYPNENVYFNFFINGLKGAQKKDFPSWGNSFGNAYLEGIKWLNENAPKDSKLTLIQGTLTNVPSPWIREDISFTPENFSGIYQKGEYIMELIMNTPVRVNNYNWEFVEKFLEPVYQVKVDGVSILNIWKNDLKNSKYDFEVEEKLYVGNRDLKISEDSIEISLLKKLPLSRVVLNLNASNFCVDRIVVYTLDDNQNWIQEKDGIPFRQIENKSNFSDGVVNFYMPGRVTNLIKFIIYSKSKCEFNDIWIKIYYLEI